MAYNDLDSMLFPEDEARRRDLEAVRATEAARQGQIDPGSQRLLERGGDIGFDPAADRARMEEVRAAYGPEGAAEYFRQQQAEKDVQESADLERLLTTAKTKKLEAEARETLAKIASVDQPEQLSIEKKVALLPKTEDEAAALKAYPGVYSELESALGVSAPQAQPEAPTYQTEEGVFTNLPRPGAPRPSVTPVAGPEPQVLDEVLGPVPQTPQGALDQILAGAMTRDIEKTKMQKIAAASAKKLDQLDIAEASMTDLWAVAPGIFKGIQGGYWNRASAWWEFQKAEVGQKTQLGKDLAFYRSRMDAAATALAKLHGEQKVSDFDAVRFGNLLADIGGWMLDFPDTQEVSRLKNESLQEMMAVTRQLAGAGIVAKSTSDWLDMAEGHLRRKKELAGVNPFPEGVRKNTKFLQYRAPKDLVDAHKNGEMSYKELASELRRRFPGRFDPNAKR